MSHIIWDALRALNDDAIDFLNDIDGQDFHLIRPAVSSDAEYVKFLNSTAGRMELRFNELQELLVSLTSSHESLLTTRNNMTGAEREKEDDDLSIFKEEVQYPKTISQLRKEVRNLRQQQKECQELIDDFSPLVNNNVVAPQARASSNFTLPQLQLPTFDGSLTSWSSFWDRFKYAVHNADPLQLPNVIKLSHLLNCLRGKALDAVSGLPVEDSSYDIAVGILADKYGRKKAVITELHGNLSSLRCDGSDHHGISKFADNLEKILLQLQHHGEDIESYTIYLLIKKKLPPFVLREVIHAENKLSNETELQMIRRKLKEVVMEREEYDCVLRQGRAENAPNRPGSFNSPRPSTTPSRDNRITGVNHQSSNRSSNSFNQSGHRFLGPSHSSANQHPIQSLTFVSSSKRHQPCSLCSSVHHISPDCDVYKDHDARTKRLVEENRCAKCARQGHKSQSCRQLVTCQSCHGNHPTMLCPRKCHGNQSTKTITSFAPPAANSHFASTGAIVQHPNQQEATTNVCNSMDKHPVLLKCVKVEVFNPNSPVNRSEALVLFDDGSTTSYVTTSLVQKLQLKRVDTSILSFGVFNEPTAREVRSDIVSLSLVAKDGPMNIHAHAMKFLTRPVPHCVVNEEDRQVLSTRAQIECSYGVPDILIGSDYYYDLDLSVLQTLLSGFTLLNSRFGYVLGGRARSATACLNHSSNVVVTLHATHSDFDRAVSDFFDLESIGIRENPQSDVLSSFQKTVKLRNQRYEVKLPWRQNPPDLPHNYGLSIGRLRSVLNNLRRKPELLQKYDGIIKEQLQLGIIEETPKFRQEDHPIHYLPHQPVVREDKGKVRVVYDASAKSSKSLNSLNDCLDPGPVLLENLAGVLLRFRLPSIVVACDIEKAFLQVAVNEMDRDVLRFLWLRDLFLPESKENLVTYRFKRVAFGLTCSPFLLAATLFSHFQSDKSDISREVLSNLYVDNILLTGNDREQVHGKCVQAKEKFSEIGMNLREFVSNDKGVLSGFSNDDLLQGNDQKFLGVSWKTDLDVLEFVMPVLSSQPVTKRSILAVIASLFDPLGLLSPVMLDAKLFFQTLWRTSKTWDESLEAPIERQWRNVVDNWSGFSFHIPRQTAVRQVTDSNLHVFVDASRVAYACCVYLLTEDVDCRVVSQLVFAKTRVRPTKFSIDTSIHRMELMAAVIGVKAITFVYDQMIKSGFPFPHPRPLLNLWTDSSTVLHWLRGTAKQEVFVENRLQSIRSVKNVTCRYVPTDDNPADIASRGCSAAELQSSGKWWNGPDWLTLQENWPVFSDIPNFDSNSKRQTPKAQIVLVAAAQQVSIVDADRFSTWKKLIRVVGYVFRFLRHVKAPSSKFLVPMSSLSDSLSASELNRATLYLLYSAQQQNPPQDREKQHLALFQDDEGLLRSKGRIQNSDCPQNTADPIFLPPQSRIVHLLIYHTHLEHLHAGSLLTLSQLRSQFWLPKGRRTIMKVVRSLCMNCRRFSVKPFQVPNFPPLPAERVVQSVPFEHTGVDYFGPLNVKFGERVEKVWISLFTCLVVRAVHLELVYDQSTLSFLKAFRRFASRRGMPKSLWSDNGSQFVLASKTLQEKTQKEWGSLPLAQTFSDYFAEKGIRWEFITERAPWKGGFYERMVGLVKNHLRKCIGKALLHADTLHTLVTEIELMVNLRPITYLSESIENSMPLRPIDFLNSHHKIRCNENFPQGHSLISDIPSSSRDVLLNYWNEHMKILDDFWKGWHKDYLLSLRERQRRIIDTAKPRVPKSAELVLLYEEGAPRSSWKTAVVVRGEPGDDGITRTAKIRLPSGHLTNRSINHLFPLETEGEISA